MDFHLTLFSKQGGERDRLLGLHQAGGPGITAVWQRTHSENNAPQRKNEINWVCVLTHLYVWKQLSETNAVDSRHNFTGVSEG